MIHLSGVTLVMLMAQQSKLERLIDAYLGMTPQELELFKTVLGVVVGLMSFVGILITRFVVLLVRYRMRQDAREDIDRRHLMISQLMLFPQKGLTWAQALAQMRFVLEIGTPPELPTIDDVLGSLELEKAAIKGIANGHGLGWRLFTPGDDNFVALQRLCVHLSGRDQDAITAAMHGRTDDFRADIDAVYFTKLRGEDGMTMPHALQAAEELLPLFLNRRFLMNLEFNRQIHREFVPAFIRMAYHFRKANVLFKPGNVDTPDKERAAGRQAAVWRVPIYTTKAPTRRDYITREEAARMLSRALRRQRKRVRA